MNNANGVIIPGFIGFGSVAVAFMRHFRATGMSPMPFYKHGDLNAVQKNMEVTGAFFLNPRELASRCRVIFAATPGAACVDVGRVFAPFMNAGHLYVDLCSAAPEKKAVVGRLLSDGGARYVDGAILGPVEVLGSTVPIIASGNGAEEFLRFADAFGMNVKAVGAAAGVAASIKLLRSVFQKGLAALILETAMAADNVGVLWEVMDSIIKSSETLPMREAIDFLPAKAVAHGKRMCAEIEACEDFLKKRNLPHAMTCGVRKVLGYLARQNPAKEKISFNLEETLKWLKEHSGNDRAGSG